MKLTTPFSRSLMAAALLALGAGAIAQTPPAQSGPRGADRHELSAHGGGRGAGDPARMQQRIERMQERMARRMAALKQKLNITGAQEGAWTSWTQAITASRPRTMQRPDRAEWERMTTPQRIDRMKAVRAERMAAMDKRADATKQLYAALTPEQQKVFDAESLGMRGGKHGGGRGGRDGGQHRRHHG
jgi:protein CpxP